MSTTEKETRDGSDYNYSWNCGIEGPTRKMAVKKMREQQIKNAFLLLLFSQGIPMIYGGDEFGNSRKTEIITPGVWQPYRMDGLESMPEKRKTS